MKKQSKIIFHINISMFRKTLMIVINHFLILEFSRHIPQQPSPSVSTEKKNEPPSQNKNKTWI